ncbi:hypothetical protein NL676_034416 [Syzygium grande]|nr:hypothetical protein NL676_034416 [Syzygium grande]
MAKHRLTSRPFGHTVLLQRSGQPEPAFADPAPPLAAPCDFSRRPLARQSAASGLPFSATLSPSPSRSALPPAGYFAAARRQLPAYASVATVGDQRLRLRPKPLSPPVAAVSAPSRSVILVHRRQVSFIAGKHCHSGEAFVHADSCSPEPDLVRPARFYPRDTGELTLNPN